MSDLTSQWGKKFFLHFSTQIEKNRKKKKKIFFWKKSIFEKKNRSRARILDLKWPLKARDIFFRPWCQYKSCRYWSSRSKYARWAKSLEPFLSKMAKSLILGHFGYKSGKIAKTDFFSKNRALLLFSPYSALTSCAISKKSLEPFLIESVN